MHNAGKLLRVAFDNSKNTGDWNSFIATVKWLADKGVAVHEIKSTFSKPPTQEVLDNIDDIINALEAVEFTELSSAEVDNEEKIRADIDERPSFFKSISSKVGAESKAGETDEDDEGEDGDTE